MIIPSDRDNALPFKNSTETPAVISSKMGISFFITSLPTLKGLIKTAKPNIRRMFETLLPITLPNIMSVLPDKCELNEMASSGADVPKATIVSPITTVGIFKFFARDDAPSTKKSAHFINTANPTTARTMFKIKASQPFISFVKEKTLANNADKLISTVLAKVLLNILLNASKADGFRHFVLEAQFQSK